MGRAGLLWNIVCQASSVGSTVDAGWFAGSEGHRIPDALAMVAYSDLVNGFPAQGGGFHFAEDPIFPALFVYERHSLTL